MSGGIDWTEIAAAAKVESTGKSRMGGTVGRALVVFAHGEGLAVCYAATEDAVTLIMDTGGSEFEFNTKSMACDFEYPERDGVYVVDIRIVDDGPGDWPGSREVAIQLCNNVPATREQWLAHLDGEYPWERKDWDGTEEDAGEGGSGPQAPG